MEIERITNPDFDQIQTYIAKSQPFILVNYASSWPATNKWSYENLSAVLKDHWIRYKRSATHIHPDFISDRLEQYHESTLKDYLSYLHKLSEKERAHYFLSGDHLRMFHYGKVNPLLESLFADIHYPEYVKQGDIVSMGMWLSFKGVFSWLHYDDNDAHNFNVQVSGSKYVILFHPDEVNNLYLNSAIETPHYNFSKVNLEDVDLETYPLFKNATYCEGVISQGDMLFIPRHWMHSFKHLGEFNINVNYWWCPDEQKSDKIFQREEYIYGLIKDQYNYLLDDYNEHNNERFNLYHGIDYLKKFIDEVKNNPLINDYRKRENEILTIQGV